MIAEKEPEVISENLNLDDARRTLVLKALNKCNDGKPHKIIRAAKLLGVSESQVYVLIQCYDIVLLKEQHYSLRQLRKSN
jgi:tRNA U34 5-carboxymethylaminomethyl modifying enzyme MnmG/GidA